MEVLTFRRCSPADIATCLRGHVRAGCEARSLAKGDLFPGPKMPVNIDIVYPQIFEGFLPVCNLFIHILYRLLWYTREQTYVCRPLDCASASTLAYLGPMD
ncbi:kinetochore protein Nuf2-like isoform X2 [Rhea pennata]|uniref:kinetochore protein Nuf2-like isoform X2 n=1 Tax=Rhea pennata TaxID=8795 RepID=UPI002E274E6A